MWRTFGKKGHDPHVPKKKNKYKNILLKSVIDIGENWQRLNKKNNPRKELIDRQAKHTKCWK